MQINKRAGQWILLIGASIISFALAEGAARMFLSYNMTFDERPLVSVEYSTSGYARQLIEPHQDILDRDSDGKLQSEWPKYHINNLGYRGPDLPEEKPAGEIRIVIMGGSHVFDLGAQDYEGNPGWPQLIEDGLREAGYDVRVVNMGQPGDSTPDLVAKTVLQLEQFAPDIVILNSEWNDAKWIAAFGNAALIRRPPGALVENPFIVPDSLLDRLFGWSVIYRKSHDAVLRVRFDLKADENVLESLGDAPELNPDQIDAGLAQYQRHLEVIVFAVRGLNAMPILAIEERLVDAENDAAERELIDYYKVAGGIAHSDLVGLFEGMDTRIRSVAELDSVMLIDVNALMGGNVDYFYDHVHTTVPGSQVLAAEYILLLTPLLDDLLAAQP